MIFAQLPVPSQGSSCGNFPAKTLFQLFPGSPQKGPGCNSDRKNHFYKISCPALQAQELWSNTKELSKLLISACLAWGWAGHCGCGTNVARSLQRAPNCLYRGSLGSCWERFCFGKLLLSSITEHVCMWAACKQHRPLGLAWFKCLTLNNIHTRHKFFHGVSSPPPLPVSHSAQTCIFSNSSCRHCDSLQSEETLSCISWGQFFMTET